jgi:hypothetical protein
MTFVLRALVASSVLALLSTGLHPSWEGALSSLMIGAVLCWLAAVSRASGADLVVALAGLYFVPAVLTTIPEGVLFDVVKIGDAPVAMAMQFGVALAAAATITALFGRWKAAETPVCVDALSALGLIWRLTAGIAVFVFCYGAAGMAIFPFVKEFYQGRAMPGPEAMIAMQVMRAVALMAAARLALRHVPSSGNARWILALAFPVIGDIALMIPHNDLMPPAVRLVHALEILPYYALCGFLFAVWFGPPRRDAKKGEQE